MTKAARYDTVLFDLDGTLLDTAPDLAYAMNTVLDEHGHPPVRYPLFRSHVAGGSNAMIRHSFAIADNHPDFSSLKQKFLLAYEANLVKNTSPFPGIEALLEQLDINYVRWGIVTNKPGFLTAPLLNHFSITARCCCIVSGDTLPTRKPDPEPLLYACQISDCSPERTLYIGDTQGDIIAAHAAGMDSVAVTYGYHPKNSHPNTWRANAVVESAADILTYLRL